MANQNGELPPPPYSLHDPTLTSSTSRYPVEDASGEQESNLHVSAAAYFEMRPPPSQRSSSTLPCHIAVLPGTTAEDLPLPEPKRILLERDVESHDWMTFVNHLVPYSSLELTGKRPDQKHAKPIQELFAADASEPLRQKRVFSVVSEWNKGFFLPRGINIVVRVAVTPGSYPQTTRNIQEPTTQQSTRLSRNSIPSNSLNGLDTVDLQRRDMSKGEKPRNTDTRLGLALYAAVAKQDARTVRLLLENGADPNAKPSWETPAIVVAVKRDNMAILDLLLEYTPDLDAYKSGEGTALYTAVSKGKTEMVKRLLRHGADPNMRPTGSEPTLYKAVSKEYDDIVQMLLQKGVKIDDTPPGGNTTLHKAVAKGNVGTVRALLDAGAKVDIAPHGGNTAFFEAATKGKIEIAELLLKNGAQVDTRPFGGNTALWNIIQKKNEPLVRLLLDHGADINAKAWGGETVLERAVKKGATDMVELLLQYKHT